MNSFVSRTLILAAISAIGFFVLGCGAGNVSRNGPYLITGHGMTATAQSTQSVGDFPMNLIATPNNRFVISSDMGAHESLWSIDTRTGQGVSHMDFPNARPGRSAGIGGENDTTLITPGSPTTNGLYYGLAISLDHTLYASQGAHDSIAILHLGDAGKLTPAGAIKTRKLDFPAGLAIDSNHHLFVANNAGGGNDPLKMSGSIAIYDTTTKKELGRYTFSNSYGGTSNFPYGIAALSDGSKCFVASERDDAVYCLNTSNPSHPVLTTKLSTGAHPVALLLSKNQQTLYVSNSLGDTVSIIDTQANKITDTIMLRSAMVRDIPGVTPLGLALSPNQKTLYVALADMDAIGVIDLKSNALTGYIPAGWYPSSLATDESGKRLLIANARGTNFRNPNNHPDPHNPKNKSTPILANLDGNVTAIAIPTGKSLERTTERVLHNNRLDNFATKQENPLAKIGLASGNITHVIYIIKENRTYDQVLGDEKAGNGDPSLVMFGRDVTPNLHALTDRFVLLDNLYACGEVSGDGWTWSTQGMADAYVSRNVPYSYSHRGRFFDFEGMNNGYPTAGAPANINGKPASRPPFPQTGIPAVPNVGGTNRFIWTAAADARIHYRNYGFFLYFSDSTGIAAGPDNYPCSPGLLPIGHDLAGITDYDFRRFDLNYPDSDAPMLWYKKTSDKNCLFNVNSYGIHQANSRFAEWNYEFQEMLQKDPSGNSVPALMMLRMMTDHTEGARSDAHTPRSYVADNDFGIGQIVQAVSHSSIWLHTAIFVIEDDAQNGSDHVDAHRTTAYVISPWIKAHSVDHHFYNTDSMLKTIELLLDLHPLSQFDAVADPIMDWDASPQNASPFAAILPSKELIAQRNPRATALRKGDPRRAMALESDKMDFTHADAAPTDQLNQITWKTIKGPNSVMPPPRGISTDDDD